MTIITPRKIYAEISTNYLFIKFDKVIWKRKCIGKKNMNIKIIIKWIISNKFFMYDDGEIAGIEL